jgi:hypothetical protein
LYDLDFVDEPLPQYKVDTPLNTDGKGEQPEGEPDTLGDITTPKPKDSDSDSDTVNDDVAIATTPTPDKDGEGEGEGDKGVMLEGAPQVDRVVVASFTDGAQGPIVALALGLAITMILLVFVGCRLRTVKRRLRKGRALHTNEADYLINGMYL